MEAWLSVGKDVAVVSHETALELLGLSNVIPNAVHLTVPRSKRHLPSLRGVVIHTTTRQIGSRDVVTRDGIRLTDASRSIVDSAEAGTAPEQIELAIKQAIDSGFSTPQRLTTTARERSRRVQELVSNGLRLVNA